ncbi:putative RNA-binding protein, partial [Trypanosoma grayi]|uniref:putative RNA-binding protein n=1 Tax=Trypanosoma grayi TaxID=71804 RepID=UPI0004F41D43
MSLSSVFSCPYSLALPEQHDRQKQQEQQLEQQYHNHQQQQQQQQEPVASSTPLPTKEVQNSLQRRNVYVSGLPETYRAADFRELCQEFGRVEASKLCVDSKCRPTKGYGFALFYDEADAAWCIKNLNGRWIGGRSLQAR